MAKNKLNKNWLHDHINDPYVKLAQKEGYRARAAYKQVRAIAAVLDQDRPLGPDMDRVQRAVAAGSFNPAQTEDRVTAA